MTKNLLKHKYTCNYKNNKGLTLVELMIALTILVIVLSLGYSLLFLGSKNFDAINSKTYVQQNVRIVDQIIKKELRNATVIEIAEEKKEHIYSYYIKLENGYLIKNGKNITENIITDVKLKKIEQINEDKTTRYTLSYKIISIDGTQEQIIDNLILLNNINEAGNFIMAHEECSLKEYALYYNLPTSP